LPPTTATPSSIRCRPGSSRRRAEKRRLLVRLWLAGWFRGEPALLPEAMALDSPGLA
jgi:hypothetical protein